MNNPITTNQDLLNYFLGLATLIVLMAWITVCVTSQYQRIHCDDSFLDMGKAFKSGGLVIDR